MFSVQRALVGEVTRDIRAIDVVIAARRVSLRVSTEGEPSAKSREDLDAGAVTQVVADFPCPDGRDPEIAYEFVRCDFPERCPSKGYLSMH